MLKRILALILASLMAVAFLSACSGEMGSQGEQGIQGVQGLPGEKGEDGNDQISNCKKEKITSGGAKI